MGGGVLPTQHLTRSPPSLWLFITSLLVVAFGLNWPWEMLQGAPLISSAARRRRVPELNSANGFIHYGNGGEFATNNREEQETTMPFCIEPFSHAAMKGAR